MSDNSNSNVWSIASLTVSQTLISVDIKKSDFEEEEKNNRIPSSPYSTSTDQQQHNSELLWLWWWSQHSTIGQTVKWLWKRIAFSSNRIQHTNRRPQWIRTNGFGNWVNALLLFRKLNVQRHRQFQCKCHNPAIDESAKWLECVGWSCLCLCDCDHLTQKLLSFVSLTRSVTAISIVFRHRLNIIIISCVDMICFGSLCESFFMQLQWALLSLLIFFGNFIFFVA